MSVRLSLKVCEKERLRKDKMSFLIEIRFMCKDSLTNKRLMKKKKNHLLKIKINEYII